MADLYAPELDHDVHRLLPPEIFADIGINTVDIDDATAGAAAAVQCTVVEELAAHLVGVLGLTSTRYQRRYPPPMTAAAAAQGCGAMNGRGGATASIGGGNGGGMACYAPAFGKDVAPPFDFDFEAMQRAQSFVPAVRCAAGARPRPPRHQSCTGTGVFLPRADAYQTRPASKPAARPLSTSRKESAAAANPPTPATTRQHALRPRGEI